MSQLENNTINLPLLDLSKPIEPSMLASLSEACKEWGFFYVTNHGIPSELFERVSLISKSIFDLPSASKLKIGPLTALRTYTPHFIASPYFESLRVSGPDFLASAKASADELSFPQNSEFCEILQEYGDKMMELSKRITEVLLMSMGNEYPSKFSNSEFDNCHGYLRIINYSPPRNHLQDSHTHPAGEEVEGLGMHTDMSCITVVHQDRRIGGLQVRSNAGDWVEVVNNNHTPGDDDREDNINSNNPDLVVNIGDLMQAWSNGRLRSSQHRVVLRGAIDRLSLAFFWGFEDEKVVEAPDEVVGEGNLRVYKAFVCKDYLKFREINNEVGKFEKIGFTVKDFAGLENIHPLMN